MQKEKHLLSKEDLDLIEPYLPFLVLDNEKKDYIKLSRKQFSKKRRRLWMFSSLLALIIILALSFLLIRSEIYRHKAKEVQSFFLTKLSQDFFRTDPTKGLQFASLAYENLLGEMAPKVSENFNELCREFVNNKYSFSKILTEFPNLISSAVFSPDGQKIITASGDNTARIWDVSGELLVELKGYTGIVSSANFSPDGQKILTIGDITAKIWDVSGKLLAELKGHTGIVSSAKFSPDGQKILTASWDSTARIWDVSGKLLAELKGHKDIVSSAVFSPDGQKVLTTSWDNTARIWSVSGELLVELKGHTDDVYSAIFSPNGEMVLTASYDNTVKIWDINGNINIITELVGLEGLLLSAVFSPDGKKILTASMDGTVIIWDLKGHIITELIEHDIRSAVFSPDGLNILITSGSTARIWSVSGELLAVLKGHTDIVKTAVFSLNGQKVLTASSDGTARTWLVPSGTEDYLANLNCYQLTPQDLIEYGLDPDDFGIK